MAKLEKGKTDNEGSKNRAANVCGRLVPGRDWDLPCYRCYIAQRLHGGRLVSPFYFLPRTLVCRTCDPRPECWLSVREAWKSVFVRNRLSVALDWHWQQPRNILLRRPCLFQIARYQLGQCADVLGSQKHHFVPLDHSVPASRSGQKPPTVSECRASMHLPHRE